MDIEKKQKYLNIDSSLYQTNLDKRFENRKKYFPADPRKILSYIPGTVIDVYVSPGMTVKQGQDLMTVDAMKMKNRIKCNIDGKVKSVNVASGTKVGKGTVLLELE
ncbi:MAG TPA: acetyl-CoA carboxylase biotin carboxyl carrier protein subunit [Bacteroidales bacterium]|jgi:biotin carboxyl carrier protein|nr:acetyl-CoA carboxylase biotin carboxyl carrier protein subunit [Bacteroidales bacterium]